MFSSTPFSLSLSLSLFFQNTPGTSAALASGNSFGNRRLYHLLHSAEASTRLTETQTRTRSGRTPAEVEEEEGDDGGGDGDDRHDDDGDGDDGDDRDQGAEEEGKEGNPPHQPAATIASPA